MRFFLRRVGNITDNRITDANQILKKIWISVILATVVLVGLMVTCNSLEWYIAVAMLQILAVLGGSYLFTRAEALLASFCTSAGISGMPNIKVGEILTAFKKNVSLPDFEIKKFADAGMAGVIAMLRVWAYVVIGIGIFSSLLTMFHLRNPLALLIAFGALFTLAAIDFARPGKAKWFFKIAMAFAIVQLLYGLFAAFTAPSSTEAIALKAAAQSQKNLDKQYAEKSQSLLDSANAGYVLTPRQLALLNRRVKQVNGENAFKKVAGDIFGVKMTKKVKIESLQDQPLSGLEPGATYRFSVKGPVTVQALDQYGNVVNNLELNGFMTVDGVPLGEEVTVNLNGTIVLSLMTDPKEKSRKITPNAFDLIAERTQR